jgi:alkanesulfonate monooxygenase SsuD/methylene tetrahydromethanopterin reductase-like flavin-dependent oxidoreductase (luciferase family)
VVAGLARDTQRISLGVLVSPVTFRNPGNLAKVVVTADELSGGRVEVGLGAGWHADEHRRHGFPFPEIAERAEMLEETLEIVRGLWDGPDGWSFSGRHFSVEDTLFRPKPGSLPGRDGRHPNILVGGQGTPRSFRIAARYADEFNLSSTSPDGADAKFTELDAALRAVGRDPTTLVHSVMAGVLLGRDEAELKGRERDLMAVFGGAGSGAESEAESEAWLATRRPRWVLGTPDEARDVVRRFAAVGVERLMLQDFLPRDLDMIDLAAEVLFDV